VLGPMLFSSKDTKHSKRNLLLFITPHIVSGTVDSMTAVQPEAYDVLMKSRTEPAEKEPTEKNKNIEAGAPVESKDSIDTVPTK